MVSVAKFRSRIAAIGANLVVKRWPCRWRHWLGCKAPKHNVALVLSGGGARGLAHIGALEALQVRGYRITSVAGTSMGALVGGLFAAGCLPQLKAEVLALDRKRLRMLMTPSLGLDHVASGDGLTALLYQWAGHVSIEQLTIPFCCSATDVATGEEHIFRSGTLVEAIRASVSIPCFFQPVTEGTHIYVDGSVHNVLPLDAVARSKNDLLVAMNVNGKGTMPYVDGDRQTSNHTTEAEKHFWAHWPLGKHLLEGNFLGLMLRVARLSIQAQSQRALRLTPPDICAELPIDSFSLFDFDKAEAIIEAGRRAMNKQLDGWEQTHY